MKPTVLICLVAAGLFGWLGYYCTLHAKPRHQQTLMEFTASKLAAYHPPASAKPRCGDDWLCLVAWANEQHPKKGKRHG